MIYLSKNRQKKIINLLFLNNFYQEEVQKESDE